MKSQTYYNTKYESEANINDLSNSILLNCVGVVNETEKMNHHAIRHDYYLMYMREGSMELILNGVSQQISEGQIVIISPETDYWYKTKNPTHIHYWFIHFTGSKVIPLLKKVNIPCNTTVTVGIHSEFEYYFKRIFREFSLNDALSKLVCESLFCEVACEFSRCIYNNNHRIKLSGSIIYIAEHYNQNISIANLAKLEGLSEQYYRLLFKQITGQSPNDYIINHRMENAKRLLIETDKDLSSISEEIGYSDVYYFGRIFKNKVGISPGKYRKQFE